MRVATAALTVLVLAASAPGRAHHGVASLGAAGLEGPGAPLETSSSATLPPGSWLLSYKLDRPVYRRATAADDGEARYNHFQLFGIGYGIRPWLSMYAFLPHTRKVNEAGGGPPEAFGISARGDVGLSGVIGFKHDRDGIALIPANESLDDLEEWHFTAYAGTSLPTGRSDVRNPNDNSNDPGMNTGFRKPTVSLGLTATRMLTQRLTASFEAGLLRFREVGYADDGAGKPFRGRYGPEDRANAALSYRLHSDAANRLRVDGNLELNWLQLGRDTTNGVGDVGTGGRVVYLVPGFRVSVDRFSLAAGIKKRVWKRLNEDDLGAGRQQGAEGNEKYRLILSASMLF